MIFSPAKANLFFRVLSKRPDGYHQVASLYTALNLGDWIGIEQSKEDQFASNLQVKDNLVLRARDAFRVATKIIEPVSIMLDKRVPIGAGLGGGSSNAATTLWAMNELFQKPLDVQELITLAGKIGSDPPFFFSSGLAYCTGRGEELHSVDFSFDQPFWIAKPEGSLLTPHVYGVCKPNGVSDMDPKEVLRSFKEKRPVFVNDLEPAAFQLMPELKVFKKSLVDLGFSEVVMTGSGTAFLCFGDVQNPCLPRTSFYPVKPIRRDSSTWY